ncbi:MAG: HrcA family transcriptional regulator [Campylobacterales bacterium]|nr:HrcA family transcriptional regulator [Campylobacterales bacterium]
MPRVSKRDLILDSIIKAYLEENLPIGSSELGLRMPGDIPASTIRVYFKKLSQEGVLTQLHVSGGRVPTDVAMKQYWEERLRFDRPLRLSEKLAPAVDAFGLYCLVLSAMPLQLQEIVNIENRYLLLLLGGEEIVLGYSNPVERFLTSLIGASPKDLESIGAQVGLYELRDKAARVKEAKVLFKRGEMSVYEMAKAEENPTMFRLFLDPGFPDALTEGLFFEDLVPEGYVAMKHKAIYQGEDAHVFCLGGLYADYERFFMMTKEDA